MALSIKGIDFVRLIAVKALVRKVLQVAINFMMYNIANNSSFFIIPDKVKMISGVIVKQIDIYCRILYKATGNIRIWEHFITYGIVINAQKLIHFDLLVLDLHLISTHFPKGP